MQFRILGPVGIWSGAAEVPLSGTKQRTMLAALLLAGGRVIPDYRLSQALWGSEPPSTHQAQLYTYASRLRQHLEEHAEIVRKGSGYLMRITAGRFDYGDFTVLCRAGRDALSSRRYDDAADNLRAALSLWRGPTLTDVTDHLGETERPIIEESYMEALEGRILADLALGRHDQLASELIGLVQAHPLRETLRAQLMVVLYASNRQAEAFAVYHEGRRRLEEELGVDPGSALRRTYEAILAGGIDQSWYAQLIGVPTQRAERRGGAPLTAMAIRTPIMTPSAAGPFAHPWHEEAPADRGPLSRNVIVR
ncbi:AfsR/SARP family transcriptional regulator [Streptomyces sp. NRRL B-3648]|uniref:AfsR/SARP family transcriptional regulator n=1 Tax=Streptomyces sp. NRRL B-3648 TaxID=1519493 RepID=UPI0007C78D1E|nr:AfsR/SARP family transcriptional regulator [Streptomyces sp. NRRL B-3648]